jgi:hypothetical protein
MATSHAIDPRSRRAVALAVIMAVVLGLSLSAWRDQPNWSNPDSLFYQSMSLEVGGLSAQRARAEVFHSQLAKDAIAAESSVATLRWQAFESKFSRRRWLVPIVTAAVKPVAGQRALEDVVIIGYYVLALALGAFLMSRFGAVESVLVLALCLALGPVRNWELRPMTDSWGLAFEVLALMAAVSTKQRGLRWASWIAAMLALSFTRDLAVIPLVAVAWVTWRARDPSWRRRGPRLLVTGVLATAPAYLIFGASLRLTLAFQMSAYQVPTAANSTWGHVLSHYPSFAWSNIYADYQFVLSNPLVGLVFVAGIVALFALPANHDPRILLMRGATIGWLLVLAIDPDYTAFRYELTALPAIAFGLCMLAERGGAAAGLQREAKTIPPAW